MLWRFLVLSFVVVLLGAMGGFLGALVFMALRDRKERKEG